MQERFLAGLKLMLSILNALTTVSPWKFDYAVEYTPHEFRPVHCLTCFAWNITSIQGFIHFHHQYHCTSSMH